MTHDTTPLTDREPSKTTREDLLFFSTLGCPPHPTPPPPFLQTSVIDARFSSQKNRGKPGTSGNGHLKLGLFVPSSLDLLLLLLVSPEAVPRPEARLLARPGRMSTIRARVLASLHNLPCGPSSTSACLLFCLPCPLAYLLAYFAPWPALAACLLSCLHILLGGSSGRYQAVCVRVCLLACLRA